MESFQTFVSAPELKSRTIKGRGTQICCNRRDKDTSLNRKINQTITLALYFSENKIERRKTNYYAKI